MPSACSPKPPPDAGRRHAGPLARGPSRGLAQSTAKHEVAIAAPAARGLRLARPRRALAGVVLAVHERTHRRRTVDPRSPSARVFVGPCSASRSSRRSRNATRRIASRGAAPASARAAYHAWTSSRPPTGCRVITEETQRGAMPCLLRIVLRPLLKLHAGAVARVLGAGRGGAPAPALSHFSLTLEAAASRSRRARTAGPPPRQVGAQSPPPNGYRMEETMRRIPAAPARRHGGRRAGARVERGRERAAVPDLRPRQADRHQHLHQLELGPELLEERLATTSSRPRPRTSRPRTTSSATTARGPTTRRSRPARSRTRSSTPPTAAPTAAATAAP